MSVAPSVKYVKVGGSMVAKPVNVREAGTWTPVQNITAELYITPDSGTYTIGSTVTIVVRENSLATAVNSLQATFTYPAGLLQYQSTDVTGTPFDTPAFQSSGGSGTVAITLTSLGGSITGDNLVATVTFTVLGAGSATVAFDPSSGIARKTDSTNICNQMLGVVCTLQ